MRPNAISKCQPGLPSNRDLCTTFSCIFAIGNGAVNKCFAFIQADLLAASNGRKALRPYYYSCRNSCQRTAGTVGVERDADQAGDTMKSSSGPLSALTSRKSPPTVYYSDMDEATSNKTAQQAAVLGSVQAGQATSDVKDFGNKLNKQRKVGVRFVMFCLWAFKR